MRGKGVSRGVDATALLSWFRIHARDLPWRRPPRDPYAVWVSEVMLQQTRVETVVPYFEAFLARFPDVGRLAAAPEEALMKAWEGLGYYRRARLLQAGARAVVARHGGRLPGDVDALAALPGFGPYTAGAVASLAFGLPVPAVDGNVLRVWSRLTGAQEDVTRASTRKRAQAWVRKHQPRDQPGAFNEALMDLGATVCTPRAPRCDACPVALACLARASGRAASLPVKRAKPTPEVVRVALAVARRGDFLLLERRDDGLLAGTWGLPWVEVGKGEDATAALAAHVRRLTGGDVDVGPQAVAQGRHVFTHRRWEMEAYDVDVRGGGGAWRHPADVALGSAHRRILGLTPRDPTPSGPSRRRPP